MFIAARFRFAAVGVASLALAALLAACGGPQVPIAGTVTDAYTGQPVDSATVSLGQDTLTTDQGGKYQLSRWDKKGTLQISANGYEPVVVDLSTKPQLEKPEPPVVTLDAISIRPNVLSGTVTDSYSSQPLAGALVQVTDTLSATTGADGRYTLTGLPESFSVTVTAPDYETFSQSVSRSTALDVAVRPNILAGRITDRFSGSPVAGATVASGDASVTTDAEGRYRLEGTRAGNDHSLLRGLRRADAAGGPDHKPRRGAPARRPQRHPGGRLHQTADRQCHRHRDDEPYQQRCGTRAHR
jgi:protocatechuate 3,4-dioxygenase beta subunit